MGSQWWIDKNKEARPEKPERAPLSTPQPLNSKKLLLSNRHSIPNHVLHNTE